MEKVVSSATKRCKNGNSKHFLQNDAVDFIQILLIFFIKEKTSDNRKWKETVKIIDNFERQRAADETGLAFAFTEGALGKNRGSLTFSRCLLTNLNIISGCTPKWEVDSTR